MTNYTVAINAYFHSNIRIYYIDSGDTLEAIKRALIIFIRETMNMYHIGKEPLIKEVRNINSLEYLMSFLKNNSINCTFQETPNLANGTFA